jgi:hypothetical protein
VRVKIHVRGLKGDGPVKEGEEPSALYNGLLEVDGHLIEEVTTIEVLFGGGDIATVKPHLIPGSFEVVTHTDESWPELLNLIHEQKSAYGGTGRIVASTRE